MEIVAFLPEHAGAFAALNEAWISKYFHLEPRDKVVLADPQGQIIDRGGRIFMALQDGEPVGCVAMLAMLGGAYEIAKMTVSEKMRGAGLGRALLDRCIEAAQEDEAPRLYLETNSALAPALSLYRAMGFHELPPHERPPTDYARVDVWMERKL